jgi:hypothetical protein
MSEEKWPSSELEALKELPAQMAEALPDMPSPSDRDDQIDAIAREITHRYGALDSSPSDRDDRIDAIPYAKDIVSDILGAMSSPDAVEPAATDLASSKGQDNIDPASNEESVTNEPVVHRYYQVT